MRNSIMGSSRAPWRAHCLTAAKSTTMAIAIARKECAHGHVPAETDSKPFFNFAVEQHALKHAQEQYAAQTVDDHALAERIDSRHRDQLAWGPVNLSAVKGRERLLEALGKHDAQISKWLTAANHSNPCRDAILDHCDDHGKVQVA
jgi:hypothetical protein